MRQLAGVRRDRGDARGAEPLARKALEGFRRRLGSDHPQTIRAVEILAAVLLDIRQIVEAESLAREALAKRAGWPKPQKPPAAFVQSVLGACLAAQGHDAEAERLLIEGYEGLCARPAPPGFMSGRPWSESSPSTTHADRPRWRNPGAPDGSTRISRPSHSPALWRPKFPELIPSYEGRGTGVAAPALATVMSSAIVGEVTGRCRRYWSMHGCA